MREEFVPVKVVLYTDILTAVLLVIDEIIFFTTLMIFSCYDVRFGLVYILLSVLYFGSGLCFFYEWQKLKRSKKISIYMKKIK